MGGARTKFLAEALITAAPITAPTPAKITHRAAWARAKDGAAMGADRSADRLEVEEGEHVREGERR